MSLTFLAQEKSNHQPVFEAFEVALAPPLLGDSAESMKTSASNKSVEPRVLTSRFMSLFKFGL